MRRATMRPDNPFVWRLGEAGYGPGDGRVGTLDLLARSGLPVPGGFVLTGEGHRESLRASPTRGGRRGLGGTLEREVRAALLDLGARTVVVGWARGSRGGLGTIPAVVAAVREAWAAAGGPTTGPILVQRRPRPDYTGWTSTADLHPGPARRGDAPLYDVGPAPGSGLEDVAALTRRAAGVLGGGVRLGWGLEDGRWLLVAVSEETKAR